MKIAVGVREYVNQSVSVYFSFESTESFSPMKRKFKEARYETRKSRIPSRKLGGVI